MQGCKEIGLYSEENMKSKDHSKIGSFSVLIDGDLQRGRYYRYWTEWVSAGERSSKGHGELFCIFIEIY